MDREIKAKTHSSHTLIRLEQTDKLPSKKESEDTPLRILIMHIPVRYWSMFSGIRLCSKLGFNSAMLFSNLHQLMRYIGFNKKVFVGQQLPYQYYIARHINNVTLNDLINASQTSPSDEMLERIKLQLPKHMQ